MSSFYYRAVERNGTRVEGVLEAESLEAVTAWLKDQNLLPIQIRRGKPSLAERLKGLNKRAMTKGGRLSFTRDLAVLIGAGLTLENALRLLARSTVSPHNRQWIDLMLTEVQAGKSFAACLEAQGFPTDYVAMVTAAEAGGFLPLVLDRLAQNLERSERQRERVISALIYPAILVLMSLLMVTVIVAWIVPAFEPLFAAKGQALPPATQALLWVAGAMRHWGGWLMLEVGVAGFAIIRLKPSHSIRLYLSKLALSVPVLGSLVVSLQTAQFAQTIGILLANGVAILPTLEMARATLTNGTLQQSADRLSQGVRLGIPLSALIQQEPYWPPLMHELARVGEETGRLAPMMLKLGDITQEEALRRLDRLVALVTPLVTLLLGVVIAGVLTAMLSAVLSVNELAF